jgi:hypothetical protein
MLDSGWAAAIAAIITAIIVAGTAVAAFRQLRHNRHANEMVIYLRLIDFMDSPGTTFARQNLRTMAERVRTDSDYRTQLTDPAAFPEEFRQIAETLRFLEHISVLISKGGVAENLVLAEYADTFSDMWDQMRPAIELRRVAFGPYVGRAFEHLAVRAKRHIESGAWDRECAALERDTRDITTL